MAHLFPIAQQKRHAAVVAVAALLVSLGGCADAGSGTNPSPTQPPSTNATEAPHRPEPAPKLHPPPCPPDETPCVRAAGTIVYVQRVDPDGDGDAHFVLADSRGITGPGITVIDVRRDLRPQPLPGPGDELGAAGPVFPGSFGQHQIQAVAVTVAP